MHWSRNAFLATPALALFLSLVGCGDSKPAQKAAPAAQEPQPAPVAAKYVCPMHPEVTSAAAGQCSKCGMDLVPAEANSAPSDTTKAGSQ